MCPGAVSPERACGIVLPVSRLLNFAARSISKPPGCPFKAKYLMFQHGVRERGARGLSPANRRQDRNSFPSYSFPFSPPISLQDSGSELVEVFPSLGSASRGFQGLGDTIAWVKKPHGEGRERVVLESRAVDSTNPPYGSPLGGNEISSLEFKHSLLGQ